MEAQRKIHNKQSMTTGRTDFLGMRGGKVWYFIMVLSFFFTVDMERSFN